MIERNSTETNPSTPTKKIRPSSSSASTSKSSGIEVEEAPRESLQATIARYRSYKDERRNALRTVECYISSTKEREAWTFLAPWTLNDCVSLLQERGVLNMKDKPIVEVLLNYEKVPMTTVVAGIDDCDLLVFNTV